MQLNPAKRKQASLTAATLSLLGIVSPASHADGDKTWLIDTAALVYSESGGRVQAFEPVISLRKDLGDERLLSGKLVLDTLTGASPNGATPSSTPQTFSQPSGKKGYTTPAFQTPLDPSFKDTRVAGSGNYEFPVSEQARLGFGLNGSVEHDFLSAGGNLRYSHDLNQKNTTLSAGLALEADYINPEGGAPTALAQMMASNGNQGGGDDDEGGRKGPTKSKTVVDATLGLTQIIDPQSLVQFNYSLSQSNGYHTDPYKLVSVVDNNGEPVRYLYESRPTARTKHALFGQYKRFVFDRDVVELSYRYLTDTWSISSHTVDMSYRFNLTENFFIEPHLRGYKQTAADFYRVALSQSEAVPSNVSADERLGSFTGTTGGLNIGGRQWDARLEYYQQKASITGVPAQAEAGLSKFKLVPDFSAVMFTVGYRFAW